MRQFQNHRPQHWPLSRQIIATSIVAVLIVGVAIGELVRKTEKEILFTDLQNQNMQTVELLSAASFNAVISEDRPLIESIIEQLVTRAPEIVSVVYKNETGKVLASWKGEEPIEEKFVKTYSEGIEQAGEAFGTLTIEWNIDSGIQIVQGRVDRIRLYVAASLLTVTLVFLILTHWLALSPISVIHKRLSDRSQPPPPSGLALPAHSSKELVGLWNSADLLAKTLKTLRESEARIQDIAEAATDRFWEMDETLHFTSMFYHPGSTVFLAAEKFIGRTRWGIAGEDPDKDKKWAKHRDDLLAHRPFRDFQFAIKDEDGVSRYLSVSGRPFFDEEGNFRGYRGSATDITERKRAEIHIRQLATAIEDMSEIFALYDADDRLVMCNKGFRDINRAIPEVTVPGIFYEEHLRVTVEKGLVPEVAGREEEWIRERLERHLNPGEPFEVARDDGRWFLIKEQRLPGGAIATIGMEITQRKQAEAALKESEEDLLCALVDAEQANQAKSEFLATMSHELRTPLNAILGFADIISHQYFGPTSEKYKEYANDIQSSGEHLLELVNEILDLSAIEAGKQSLDREKLSTMEIVRECERIIEDKARFHGIDLVTEVSKNLPPLYADRRAAKQILLNLLSNAVKFTPQGGKITVSAKASKRNTTLKIADTGKGIPADKLPKLTDPFTRVDGDPYLAEPGWGLGLAITKSLIDLHDGTLDIKSRIGKGTTVTVTFPNGAP